MAYDTHLAERIARIFNDKKLKTVEKKMMGGLAFMLDNKMCCGIVKNELMARIGPDAYESALKRPGVNKMNFTGRPMTGYVFIDGDVIDKDSDLEYWIELCIDFNPLAKSSKKKK